MQIEDDLVQQNKLLTKQVEILNAELQELKCEKEVLSAQVRQFRTYFEIVNGYIVTAALDGTFTYHASNWLKSLGYDVDDPNSKFIFAEAVHPDDFESCRLFLEKTFTTGSNQTGLKYRLRHKDGSWKWMSANSAPVFDRNGAVIQVLTVAWDITDFVETELMLKGSSAKLGLLFDTMREGVAIVDNDDIVQLVNKSCCDLFGFTAEDIIGKPGNEFIIAEEDRHLLIEKNIARTQGVSDEYEIKGQKMNGENIWLRISGAPLRDEDGIVIGSVGIITDITESKALREKLVASQKLEIIGKLAGGIAHDFNNLLTIILGYSEELNDGLPQDSPLRVSIAEVLKAGERASGLTRQLLSFSRMQITKPRVLDVNELLGNIEKLLHRLMGNTIEIKLTLDESLPPVKIDPSQIELIIVNLAVNAQEAMPQGGVLSIDTTALEVGKDLLPSRPDIKPGQYVKICLSDTGCGMDELVTSKMFDPFFTTKGIGTGIGLGLSTVYGIVNQADGCILVESELGKGTSISILLPASYEAVGRTSPQSHELCFLGKGEHILIVEDEKALLSYFAKLIKNLGYKVSSCSDSREALDLIRNGLRPDLMITDVIMPVMNGKQLADKVLELIPGQKVLFMSGFTNDAIVQHEVFEKGMPYIQKPFNSKDITVQIRSLLNDGKASKRSANILMLDDEEGIRKLFERSCLKRGHNFTGVELLSDALLALAEKQFDVMMIDMHLVGMNGVQALKSIREAGINTPAIVFTGAIRAEDSEALKPLGVIKTVEKSFDNEPILIYIEGLLSGG
ncbi:MAG: hypothetical protein CVU50_07630 [Candidatus Cloacimonetes bacterium HGW-Cloacimonetes-3]|jgi:PAS domain S-box-containing protein|nr:MAG: hypothetical protein CVU50_07630 [Candidatus Cloacimonetes bacterium HGW-Cloacimonetes-3]